MLERTALVGSIRYRLADIKYLLTSPKTGEIRKIVIDYDDIATLANDTVADLLDDKITIETAYESLEALIAIEKLTK